MVILEAEDTNAIELARLMVGRNVDFSSIAGRSKEEMEQKEVVMKIRNLAVDMPGEQAKNVDLDIRKGEILGLCGLAGQGNWQLQTVLQVFIQQPVK